MTLIIPSLTFFAFLLLGLSFFRRKGRILLQMMGMFFVAYVLVLGQNQYYENKFLSELKAFDSDGDGIYSSSEQTEGFEIAMKNVVNDTGRTFAPVLGFIISVFFALFLGSILKLQSIILRKRVIESGST